MELTGWDAAHRWAGTTEWTAGLPADLPAFSGVIRYTAAFRLPERVDRAVLRVEDAGETVTGELNGRPLPMRLSWPYAWDIGAAVRGGDNTLTLEVATTLAGQRRDVFSTYMALPLPGLTGRVTVEFDEAAPAGGGG